jgi:hypothetical protein
MPRRRWSGARLCATPEEVGGSIAGELAALAPPEILLQQITQIKSHVFSCWVNADG